MKKEYKKFKKIKRAVDLLLLVAAVAVASSAVTRSYMIRTAQPDRACNIAWPGEIHEYR